MNVDESAVEDRSFRISQHEANIVSAERVTAARCLNGESTKTPGRSPTLLTDLGDSANAGFRRVGIVGEVFLHHRAKAVGIKGLRPAEPRRRITVEPVAAGDSIAHRSQIWLVWLIVPDFGNGGGASAPRRGVRRRYRLPVVQKHKNNRVDYCRVGPPLSPLRAPPDPVFHPGIQIQSPSARVGAVS